MNVQSLKSELQQVLDNDIALRKEFTELRKSLSDYRNQLINRDEDCKRLQVNIDVLSTKLSVMERDNTAYKSELVSFKGLKETIHIQLKEKQDEIDARIAEIHTLKEQISMLSSGYERKMEDLRNDCAAEIEKIKDS